MKKLFFIATMLFAVLTLASCEGVDGPDPPPVFADMDTVSLSVSERRYSMKQYPQSIDLGADSGVDFGVDLAVDLCPDLCPSTSQNLLQRQD